jgi:hypothetical protein
MRILHVVAITARYKHLADYFKSWLRKDMKVADQQQVATLLKALRTDLLKSMQGELFKRFKTSECYDEILCLIASKANSQIPNIYDRDIDIPTNLSVHQLPEPTLGQDGDHLQADDDDEVLWLATYDTEPLLQPEAVDQQQEAVGRASIPTVLQAVVPIESKDEPSTIHQPIASMNEMEMKLLEQYIIPQHQYFMSTTSILAYQQPRILPIVCSLTSQTAYYGATFLYYRCIDVSKLISEQSDKKAASISDSITSLGRKLWQVGSTVSGRLEAVSQQTSNEPFVYQYEDLNATILYMSIEEMMEHLRHNDLKGLIFAAHGLSIVSKKKADVPRIRYALSLTADKLASMHESNQDESQAIEIIDVLMTALSESKLPALQPRGIISTTTAVVRNYLSLKAMSALVVGLILEYNIIISSTEYASVIPVICDWFVEAIKPLEYCHITNPIIPTNMLGDIISCPTPYLLGYYGEPLKVLMDLDIDYQKPDLTNRLMILKIESNEIHMPWNFEKEHYQTILSLLGSLQEAMLLPRDRKGSHRYDCDSANSASLFNDIEPYKQRDLLLTCQDFVQALLCDVESCSWPWPEVESSSSRRPYEKILLNEDLLMELKSDEIDEGTITAIMRTQMFSNYICTLFQ